LPFFSGTDSVAERESHSAASAGRHGSETFKEERLQRIRLQSILNMAGTICHEFNQPMQVLSGYIDLLLSRAWEDSKVHGSLLKIKEQTARMTQITRKLMTLNDPSVQDYAGIGKIVNLNGDQGK
jgi:signal transduction histidine kinase